MVHCVLNIRGEGRKTKGNKDKRLKKTKQKQRALTLGSREAEEAKTRQ